MAIADAPDLSSLKDKTVIITGGASGMGLATVITWAESGAYVTIADTFEDTGRQQRRPEEHHVTFVRCDVTDWASATAAFKHAISFGTNGRLDAAALYAGVVGDAGSLTDHVIAAKKATGGKTDPVAIRSAALEVNLRGIYDSAWLALYYMQGPQTEDSGAPSSKFLIVVASLGGLQIGQVTPAIGVSLSLLAPLWVDPPMVRSQMALYERDGVAPGKSMTLTPMQHVVNTASRCTVDPVTVAGKAFLIEPRGHVDFQDDEAGKWGGKVLAAGDQCRDPA